MKKFVGTCLMLVAVAAPPAQADEVTDWNQVMLRAGLIAGTSPTAMTRVAAMVQVAVFDAVNGVDPRYTHFLVDPAGAPAGASKRAAAVQAAYGMLIKLYATQQTSLDARRTVSLGEIAKRESQSAIDAGVTWGQKVANDVFASRANDGFTSATPFPAFPDGTAMGDWRRTLNLPASTTVYSAAGAGYVQFSEQRPWTLVDPSDFRPSRPPALNSEQYAKDFNEVKNMGSQTSALRTFDQTTFSLFWNSTTVSYLWNSLALSLIEGRDGDNDDRDSHWNRGKRNSLLENARLLGVLDVSMADAIIGCWDAKYEFHFWRPLTAIRDPGDDGNLGTSPDPSWVPLIVTPGHPDYPSGHSCASGAAATVLADEFGERTHFTMDSDLMLGVTRSFRSFSGALREVANARIFSGIHFRTACEVGQELGRNIAHHVNETRFQRID